MADITTEVHQTRLVLRQGDITQERVDAIVNAANSTLMGGGGVDGAIHRAGGKEVFEACKEIRRTSHPHGLPPGQAVSTTAGQLQAKRIIHTVGPVWHGGGAGEEQILESAWRESLALARKEGLRTVAFPAISTGVFGYPPHRAARVAMLVIAEELYQHPGSFDEIRIVLFDEKSLEIWGSAAQELMGARLQA